MTTLRVLVAEDNPDHRYLTVRALREAAEHTLEIHEARDGEETLDYIYGRGKHASRRRPHLVFLDLKMPRVNGLEVLQAIKSDPDFAEIPVVVLTSSDRREDIENAYRLGTNSYVTKTHSPELRDNLSHVAAYWTVRSQLPQPALS